MKIVSIHAPIKIETSTDAIIYRKGTAFQDMFIYCLAFIEETVSVLINAIYSVK